MSKPTGGPAFPVNYRTLRPCSGMTLRDYFAAKAMQGFLQHPAVVDVSEHPSALKQMANSAYSVADALLEARGE